MKVLVLGAGGGMGRVAAKTAAGFDAATKITIADLNGEAAKQIADEIGEKAAALQIDVTDKQGMAKALADCDLVLNCVGPFYRFGVPVLEQVIEAGCHYADICDDWEPTLDMLALSEKAQAKGVTCLIGLGASPGASNMLAVAAAEALDEVEEIVTGWSIESGALDLGDEITAFTGPDGPPNAALVHWMLQISGKVRVWRDGGYKDVAPLQKHKLALPGGGKLVTSSVGHPEAITLPRHFKNLKASTNVMVGDPKDFRGLRMLKRLINSKVLSYDQAAKQMEKSISEIEPDSNATQKYPPIFAWAKGTKAGQPTVAFTQMTSMPPGGMGGATGIPLALAVPLFAQGQLTKPGVFTPEEVVPAHAFFDLLAPHCEMTPGDTSVFVCETGPARRRLFGLL